jgi:MFS transporter, ACS family, tartrate transporter
MQTVEQRAISKAFKRLLPLIVVCYFIAYLDRTNVGFAALQMNEDLGLTASAFGFGAGLFFLAYVALEVPSNLMLARFGARRWIARIMVTWGLIAGGMAFVQGETSFYVMRALLGFAEAGFFPGVLFYIMQWFPDAYRARANSYLQAAGPASFLLGGPISGALLSLHGVLGLRGWQWVFIIEAVPAIIFAGVVLKCLIDRPSQAIWLEKDEREWLEERLATEEKQRRANRDHSILEALLSPRVLLLACFQFNVVLTVYSVGLFLPQIVKAFGVSNLQTGFISAIPYVAAILGILLWGRISDATGERRLFTAIPMLIGAIGLACAGFTGDLTLKMIAFSVVTFGVFGCSAVFWTLPASFLSGAAAAGGYAFINSLSAIAGFIGPWVLGRIKDATGNFNAGLYFLAGMDVLAVIIVMMLRRSPTKEPNETLPTVTNGAK